MPFCKTSKEEPQQPPAYSVQKVVIPKGMINPNETTIIEIPARLHNQPLVIAKRKVNAKGLTSETMRSRNDTTYEDESTFYPDEYSFGRGGMRERPPPQSPRGNTSCGGAADYSSFQPEANSSFFREDVSQRSNNRSNLYTTPAQHNTTTFSDAMYNTAASSKDLDETERDEKEALQKNLVEFQKARRKLLSKIAYPSNQARQKLGVNVSA